MVLFAPTGQECRSNSVPPRTLLLSARLTGIMVRLEHKEDPEMRVSQVVRIR